MKNGVTTALVLGLILLSLAELAPLLARRSWTDTLAAKLQAASENYHAALHRTVHRHPGEPEPGAGGVDDSRREYEKYQSMLLGVQGRGQTLRWALRWLGIIACGISLAFHLAVRSGITREYK